MEAFKIDGTALPPVARNNAQYSENDLQEKAYRDAYGVMHKKTVRWGVRKIELKWTKMTDAQLTLLRKLTKGKEYFSVDYYSDTEGVSGHIAEAYSGDTLKYTLNKGATNQYVWKEVSISLIER